MGEEFDWGSLLNGLQDPGYLDYTGMTDADIQQYLNEWGNGIGDMNGYDSAGNFIGFQDGTFNPSDTSSGYLGGGGSGGGLDLSKILNALGGGQGLAGLLGAGAGLLGGQRQSGTQTITSAPWSVQQPYLQDLFGRAQQAADYSTGNINGVQLDALSNMYDAAQGPMSNPMLGMDNPYLDQAIESSNQDILQGIMPMQAQADRQSGSFGNSGIAETYGREAANAMARNSNAMRMADYGAQQNLYESYVGRRYGATNALYNAGQGMQNNQFDALKNYGGLITGNYGSSQSTPMYSNPLSNAIGGGLLGLQAYNAFGSR